MDLILYHKGCPDGWCAAYIAKRRYPTAEIIACDQGIEPPYENIAGLDVLSVDLRWKNREAILMAKSVSKSFTVFDHHLSGEGEMTDLSNFVFDKTRSGAGITWDELFGGMRPWWVQYTEDRDMWRWQEPNAKEVCAYLHSYPFTTQAWDYITEITDVRSVIEIGAALVRQEQAYVEDTAQYAKKGFILGIPALVANASYFIASELGHKLYTLTPDVPVSITWYERESDDEIYFSLRGNGTVNVGEIAKKFPGGGGHHNAGGFHVSVKEGRRLLDLVLNRGQ